MTQSGAMGGN